MQIHPPQKMGYSHQEQNSWHGWKWRSCNYMIRWPLWGIGFFLDAESASLMSKNREGNVRCLIFQSAVMSQDLHMVEKQVSWLSKRVNFLGYLITARWQGVKDNVVWPILWLRLSMVVILWWPGWVISSNRRKYRCMVFSSWTCRPRFGFCFKIYIMFSRIKT